MSEGLVRLQGDAITSADIYGGVDLKDIYWRTKDGEMISLTQMTDSHLRNTALMLMGMGYQNYVAPDAVKVLWLTALRAEWERRMRARADGAT